MNIADTYAIHAYHRARIAQFGADDPKALGWKTTAGQLARFEVLCSMADLGNRSILDVGCGHGDLRAYLHEHFTGTRYLGVDQVEAFLDTGIAKYGALPDTSFFHGDFSTAELPSTDYILACGALSYRNSDPGFVFKTITKLFKTCRFGLGFNMLGKIESADGILVAYDPQEILAHCRSLTPHAVLKEGYYEDDFTVLCYNPSVF